MGLDRYTLDAHIACVDAALKDASTHVVESWRALRGELRRTRRVSERALPAVAVAAQHASMAAQHANKSLEALSEIAITKSPDFEDPDKG